MDKEKIREMTEEGRRLFANDWFAKGDEDALKRAIALFCKADDMGDGEGTFLVAMLLRDGYLKTLSKEGNQRTYLRQKLYTSFRRGYPYAVMALEEICAQDYEKAIAARPVDRSGSPVLLNNRGKPLVMAKSGRFAPVTAELSREGDTHVLTLTARLNYFKISQENEPPWFRAAVEDGVKAWSGDYAVFGGQKLRVRVNTQAASGPANGIRILFIPDDISATLAELYESLPVKGKLTERSASITRSRRTFANVGIVPWRINAPKYVMFQTDSDDMGYEQVKDVAKHEFGHVLGLGDLYAEKSIKMQGVEFGMYPELDAYYINGKQYWSVMCRHEAPVRNNDMEMVLLAFSENRFQRYQPDILGKRVSEALGRGN